MNEAFNPGRIARLHLRELTREGGEGLLLERLYQEVLRTDWPDEIKTKVMALADDIVHIYHAGDRRDDKTYATHVLRVATRLISPDHFNLRDDPQLIIVALLHDIVEDRPERLIGEQGITDKSDIEGRERQRAAALDTIQSMYGHDVAIQVQALSNHIIDPSTPIGERQQLYRKHVHELITRGGKERYVKLSDFIDNCLGLMHNPQPLLRQKLATKYMPLIPIMRIFVIGSDLSISVKNDVMLDLLHAEQLCQKYLISPPEMSA